MPATQVTDRMVTAIRDDAGPLPLRAGTAVVVTGWSATTYGAIAGPAGALRAAPPITSAADEAVAEASAHDVTVVLTGNVTGGQHDPARVRLPVRIPNLYPYGRGLTWGTR